MKMNKKRIGCLGLAASMLAAMTISASAAVSTNPGVYDFAEGEAAQTVTVQTATGDALTAEQFEVNGNNVQLYENAERFLVNLKNADANQHCLILLMKEKGTENGKMPLPTADSIYFIDQKTADGSGKVGQFNVFPKEMEPGTYSIWVTKSGSTTAQKVGSFKYHVPYMLGDIDEDRFITANDALYTMLIAINQPVIDIEGTEVPVSSNMTLAADVDKDGYVTANDALSILNLAVNN